MLEALLDPSDPYLIELNAANPFALAHKINIWRGGDIHFEQTGIAIIGICDQRFDGPNYGTHLAADAIRQELYKLASPRISPNLIDLGNVKSGRSKNDTLAALEAICEEVLANGYHCLILGGDEKTAIAPYRGLKSHENSIHLVHLCRKIEIDPHGLLYHLVKDEPSQLFNYTATGFQTYYTSADALNLMDKMMFDTLRLGEIRDDIKKTEPLLRGAHQLIFDFSAIKHSEAPGFYEPGPNGLQSEEACTIARFAGLSHTLSIFGLYNYNPTHDQNKLGAALLAQIAWFFIESWPHRIAESPEQTPEQFIKYEPAIKNNPYHLCFYKSKRSNRWWMLVKYPSESSGSNNAELYVPCTYQDYLSSLSDELPDNWLRYFQKISV